VVLGVIVLLLVIPVLIWLRNDPAEVGARPLGAPEGALAPARPPDPGVMRRAIRTSDFWFLAGTPRRTVLWASTSSRTPSITGSRRSLRQGRWR
jgi:hypothetical protein